MDLHQRYVHFPTVDLSILELLETAFKNEPFVLLPHLVQYYSTEILKNCYDRRKLETFRMVLCYEYQLLFNDGKTCTRTVPKDMCLRNIESILCLENHLQDPEKLEILYDILVLYMLLYCNPQCIEQHFLKFQKSVDVSFLNNKGTIAFSMKIMECFLETLYLQQFLYDKVEGQQFECFVSLYVKNIILWLETNDNKEWRLLASIFPKLINIFGFEMVVPTIWNFILTKLVDLKDSFAALSIIIDTCFPINAKNLTPIQYTLYNTEELWSLIIQGLKSSVQQYRKQALFVMKRITCFGTNTDRNKLHLSKSVLIPFICSQAVGTELSINNIKEKFFLVFEALEEKQYHLVAPALTHIPTLVKGNQEHVTCNNCFNISWVQLIFERILLHENHTIVKQGILYACELNAVVYDYNFLKFFIKVLNNTFLYECQAYEEEPKILENVVSLFVRIEEKEPGSIIRILKLMSNANWGPISLFYIMKALKVVSCKTSGHWKNDELLGIIKSVVQTNLNNHSHILRVGSQIELLKIISNSMEKMNNLTVLANTLYEFPSEEALARGSFSWGIVTVWLKKVLLEQDILNFVQLAYEQYVLQNTDSELRPKTFAFMIFMLHDAGLILCHKACRAENILNSILFSLNGVDTRPYADITLSIKIAELMSCLLNFNVKIPSPSITHLLSLHIDAAFKFLLKNMRSIASKLNYEGVTKYCDITISLLGNGNLLMSKKQTINYIHKFRNESVRILEDIHQYQNMHCSYALRILCFCQNILNPTPTELYVQPLLNICNTRLVSGNDQDEVSTRGKRASDYYFLLAKLTHQYIEKVPLESWHQNIDWFQNISQLCEVGGKDVVPIIALILSAIVEKKAIQSPKDWENLESIFSVCWRSTFLSEKSKLYFMAIENLIGVVINHKFLTLPHAMDFICQFLDQLLEEGENTPKLKKMLLTTMNKLDTCWLKDFQEPLLSCLLHGHVLRRDKKIENQAYLYILRNYKQCFPKSVSIIDHNNDATIRAHSVTLLHKIISTDMKYASVFLPMLLKRLEKYENKRYFNHSYIHKIKHRIMQTLLVLQPTLNEAAIVTLQEFICNLILLESNQHSVRLMQEWILIRIFIENRRLHDSLWDSFEKGVKTRPGCTSSIATIVYHVAKLLPTDAKTNFIQTGMKYIARCCLGQQFNMRLYNQVIFVELYEMLDTLNCDSIRLEYRGLYNAAIESLKDGHLMKNTSRFQDDFFLSIFHPINDYSLQSIYFELPRLTDMDTDEWIGPELFNIVMFEKNPNHPLGLHNLNSSLHEIKTSIYSGKSSKADVEALKNNINQNFDGLSDIQRKIQPSLSTTVLNNDVHNKKMSQANDSIIVVASLIDRPPNLGGLARTCEIFSIKELVIANLSYLKDKDFQSLSVSAEKWINITEIKPHHLQEYLIQKKGSGWCLVGVEQTANSTSLLNVKFDKKTILVLGNEKDGIPANLIPLFDVCIEIPQAGVIRSLNVHVAGAICIWQYAKQHMFV